MFLRLDSSGDKRLGISEFKQAVPTLAKWGVEIADPEKSFKEIDTNGGGQVLFDEFVEWALSKNLDLEDDEDIDETHVNMSPLSRDIANKTVTNSSSPQKSTTKNNLNPSNIQKNERAKSPRQLHNSAKNNLKIKSLYKVQHS